MMDLQALRTELASYAPEGWDGYAYNNGSPNTPCIIVGMPDDLDLNFTYGSRALITIPVHVLVSGTLNADSESLLMSSVVAIANTFKGLRNGTNFQTCQVTSIGEFGELPISASTSVSAAVITLTIQTPQ